MVALQDPNSPTVGTLTEGIKDLDGDGYEDTDSSSTSDSTSNSSGSSSDTGSDSGTGVVGTEGSMGDDPKLNQTLDAGSNAPMCVN